MATRIGIMGVGAIGGVVGGMLTRGGHDVNLIDQWPEHVEAMKASGLTITTRDDEYNVPVNALHAKGYPSVGCAPCSRSVPEGADERSGRWWWEQAESRECGIHDGYEDQGSGI